MVQMGEAVVLQTKLRRRLDQGVEQRNGGLRHSQVDQEVGEFDHLDRRVAGQVKLSPKVRVVLVMVLFQTH